MNPLAYHSATHFPRVCNLCLLHKMLLEQICHLPLNGIANGLVCFEQGCELSLSFAPEWYSKWPGMPRNMGNMGTSSKTRGRVNQNARSRGLLCGQLRVTRSLVHICRRTHLGHVHFDMPGCRNRLPEKKGVLRVHGSRLKMLHA